MIRVTITDADRIECSACASTITRWTSMHGRMGAWMCDGKTIQVVKPKGRRGYQAATPAQVKAIQQANREYDRQK